MFMTVIVYCTKFSKLFISLFKQKKNKKNVYMSVKFKKLFKTITQ